MRTCSCQVHLAGAIRCMHSQHEKYRQAIEPTDCKGCPLKIPTAAGEPIMPGALTKIKNLTRSVADFTADGFKTVSNAAYQARREVCGGCPMNNGRDTCTACGCGLKAKAMARVWNCELGYWDHIPHDIQGWETLPEPTQTPAELLDEAEEDTREAGSGGE